MEELAFCILSSPPPTPTPTPHPHPIPPHPPTPAVPSSGILRLFSASNVLKRRSGSSLDVKFNFLFLLCPPRPAIACTSNFFLASYWSRGFSKFLRQCPLLPIGCRIFQMVRQQQRKPTNKTPLTLIEICICSKSNNFYRWSIIYTSHVISNGSQKEATNNIKPASFGIKR
jgi:hypothetical protein